MIDILIVPQGAEYKAVIKGLCKAASKKPLIISIPIGAKQIAEVLAEKQFWQAKPKQVLMMGLCGSLSAKYSVGDTVIYNNVLDLQLTEKLTTDYRLNKTIFNKLNLEKINDSVLAITSSSIITTIRAKQQIAEKFKAEVIDMESFAYLKLLQENNISVSILRIVSDDTKYNIPNLNNAIDSTGNIKTLLILRSLIQQPVDGLRFIFHSLKALKQLETTTTKLFQ